MDGKDRLKRNGEKRNYQEARTKLSHVCRRHTIVYFSLTDAETFMQRLEASIRDIDTYVWVVKTD